MCEERRDLNPTKKFSRAFLFKAETNAGGAQCERRRQAVEWERDHLKQVLQ